MDVQELLRDANDAVSARRVYGEPCEKDGVVVIPAAAVRGGGGGGGGEEAEKKGAGGGFGLTARPVGAWIVKEGEVTWKPAVDVNRIVLGGQILALAAVLVAGRVILARMGRS